MLSVLFTICMIWFVGKFFYIWFKSILGIMKLLCTKHFLFPMILIGMVVCGLIYSLSAVDHWWDYRTLTSHT